MRSVRPTCRSRTLVPNLIALALIATPFSLAQEAASPEPADGRSLASLVKPHRTGELLRPHVQGTALRVDLSPPLREMAIAPPEIDPRDLVLSAPSKRGPNKFALPEIVGRAGRYYDHDARRVQTELAASRGSGGPDLETSIEGFSNLNNFAFGGGVNPSDAVGDVGKDYYIQYVNVGFVIFEKAAPHTAHGPFAGNSFWSGFGGPCELENAGDPIVLYDHLAERWVFSQFTGDTTPRQCFAVSATSDPFGQYHRYSFDYSQNDTVFNDYGKIGIWTDGTGKRSGYYMTSNDFVNNQFSELSFLVFERDQMLAGAQPANVGFVIWNWPATQQTVFFGAQPPHLEGNFVPPSNACAFFVLQWDDEGTTVNNDPNTDGYAFWEVCVDWNSSTFFSSDPYLVDAGLEFDSAFCAAGSCMPQPGTAQKLDTLSQFTMYRAAVRGVGDGNGGADFKMIVTHTTDAGGGRAGVHWSLFDLDSALASPGAPGGDPGPLPQLQQSSTYAPGSVYRAFGTAAIDRMGNLGIAYSASSSSLFPSVRFTGRAATDTPNVLRAEKTCVAGSGSQTGTNRWQDYASTSVDPVDGCTFWSTMSYMPGTSQGIWGTKVCAFRFPTCAGGMPGGDEIFSDGFESGSTSAWQ